MFIKHGTSRFVFCFPSLGLVFKVPIMKPISFIKTSYFLTSMAIKSGDFMFIKRAFWLNAEGASTMNIRYTLLNGIYQNWQEYRLWHKTRSIFLEPTFFSLFGFINIQKYGEELKVSSGTLWSQVRNLADDVEWLDGHHFENPSNFSYREGSIRMFDYGGRGVAEFVEKSGGKLVKSFDPNNKPDWEK